MPQRHSGVRRRRRARRGERRVSKPGLIHAVVGQNGAGKTTFARVAAGLVRPQSGEVLRRRHDSRRRQRQRRARGRRRTRPSELRSAARFHRRRGDGVRRPGRTGRSSRAASSSSDGGAISIISASRVRSAATRIRDLPVETQQGVEIARALVTDAQRADPRRADRGSVAGRRRQAVRAPSQAEGERRHRHPHSPQDPRGSGDRRHRDRAARRQADRGDRSPARETDARSSPDTIIGVGRRAGARSGGREGARRRGATAVRAGQTLRRGARRRCVELRQASRRARDAEGPALDDVSLVIRPGEIVGVAGVEGNGQRTLVRALSGLVDVTSGRHHARRRRPVTGSRRSAIGAARGLRIIPFERNTRGPQPFERAVGELVGARASALPAASAHQSPAHPARQRRRAESVGRALCHRRADGRLALRRKRAEGHSRARESTTTRG